MPGTIGFASARAIDVGTLTFEPVGGRTSTELIELALACIGGASLRFGIGTADFISTSELPSRSSGNSMESGSFRCTNGEGFSALPSGNCIKCLADVRMACSLTADKSRWLAAGSHIDPTGDTEGVEPPISVVFREPPGSVCHGVTTIAGVACALRTEVALGLDVRGVIDCSCSPPLSFPWSRCFLGFSSSVWAAPREVPPKSSSAAKPPLRARGHLGAPRSAKSPCRVQAWLRPTGASIGDRA